MHNTFSLIFFTHLTESCQVLNNQVIGDQEICEPDLRTWGTECVVVCCLHRNSLQGELMVELNFIPGTQLH